MASAHPASASVQPAPVPQPAAPLPSTGVASQASPPHSKQNLRSWWKNFSNKGPGKNQDSQGISPQLPYKPIFKKFPMISDVSVTKDVPHWLFEEPPKLVAIVSRHLPKPAHLARVRRLQVVGKGWQHLTAATTGLLSAFIFLVAKL
jgi:hypothetical protein